MILRWGGALRAFPPYPSSQLPYLLPSLVVMHITIEETDEGFVLCLLLQPSEISSELRAFASSRRGRSPLPPKLSSIALPTALSPEEPDPPPSSVDAPENGFRPFLRSERLVPLDVGVVRERPRPGAETIQAVLEQALRGRKAPLGGAIGALSRGLGNLLFGTGIDPRAGVSISQQLSEVTGKSIAEVHLGLAGPFFAEATSGGELARAIVDDFRKAAKDGDVKALQGSIATLGVTEGRLDTLIKSQTQRTSSAGDLPGAFPGMGRGILVIRSDRAIKNVRFLKRQAELMLLLAERVQEAP